MAQRLLVNEGRVACHLRRRDVGIEHCLACPWFRDLVECWNEAYILCRLGNPAAGDPDLIPLR